MSGTYAIPTAPDLPHPLGRHVHHDPQSRGFAFAAPTPRPIVDVAWRRRVGPYDQGKLGSCTANALCGALSTLPHRHRFRSQRNIVKVYSEETLIDPFPGEYAAPNWEDTGSSGLAAAKVALAHLWISRYEHAFSFDAALQALMVGAGITGTVWRSGMFRTEPDGRVRITGSDVGGHEYEVFGVDATERRVWCINSWGSGWGIGGRFYLTFQDYRELLEADGDFTVLVP